MTKEVYKKIEEIYNKKRSSGKVMLNYLNDRNNNSILNNKLKWDNVPSKLEEKDLCLYRIDKITFDKNEPSREALENVLGSLRSLDNYNFIYMILGEKDKTNLYFGIVADKRKAITARSNEEIKKVADNILLSSLKGNFRGSIFEDKIEKKKIIERIKKCQSFGVIEGVPSIDHSLKSNVEDDAFQGADRLIDIMTGNEYGLVVIAHPYSDTEIWKIRNDLNCVYDAIAPLANGSIHWQRSGSKHKNKDLNLNYTIQMGSSFQDNRNTSTSKNQSVSTDDRKENSNQVQSTSNDSYNEGKSLNNEYSIQNSSSLENAVNMRNENYNTSVGSTFSYNSSYVHTNSVNNTNSITQEGTQHSFGKQTTESTCRTRSSLNGDGTGDSISLQYQLEIGNKSADFWIDYIDNVLSKRLDNGLGKGLFLSCAYVFAEDKFVLQRLANSVISIYSGASNNISSLRFKPLDGMSQNGNAAESFRKLQIPAAILKENNIMADTVLSKTIIGDTAFCGSWLSTDELGLLAGLPHKSVIGLNVRKEVDFGLNIDDEIKEENRLQLGNLVQSGEVKDSFPVFIDRINLDKHTFVAGVTGSGKTNTCQNLLLESKLNFCIIEPAKTEYRSMMNQCSDLIVFTLGRDDIAPFYLNPFELFPGETISSRADFLKATMESSFDMEAAIPQILEAAIYKAYINKGWNIHNNTWHSLGANDENGPFADGAYAFPTLSDYVKAIEQVTNEQGFDDRLKNDYIGSIKARIQGLMVGAKGQMLNVARSIDFNSLLERKIVIELEEIKSGAEKSLLMGFILTNLMQAMRIKHQKEPNFQHITLIEEAHRLLSKFSPGDSLNKKQGVEVFTDMLAEVRKYGESFVIVDQIPDKMTPEVLKNTNTKIVHKIFAQDDKDVIGNTMALEDEQKKFLSYLPTGRAVVFTQGWQQAVQVQMKRVNILENIDERQIRDAANCYYKKIYKKGVFRGLDKLPQINRGDLEKYFWLKQYDCSLNYFKQLVDNPYGDSNIFDDFIKSLKASVVNAGEELTFLYIYWNCYSTLDQTRYDELKKWFLKILEKNQDVEKIRDDFWVINCILKTEV